MLAYVTEKLTGMQAESMTIFETQNIKAQEEIEALVKEIIL